MRNYKPIAGLSLDNVANLRSENWAYKQRPAYDLGVGYRNPALDKIRLGMANLRNDPFGSINFSKVDKTKQVFEVFPKAVRDFDYVQPHNGNAPKAKPKDLKVYIYLTGINAPNGGGAYIDFQYTPFDVDYQVTSDFKGLNIVGADQQTYHYGGSEDQLTFDIEWVGFPRAGELGPLQKAQKIARLAKSQGWKKNSPPIITLFWGTPSRDIVNPFENMYFIVEKANYRPERFTAYQNVGGIGSPVLVDNGFNPQKVKQSLTLKRVQ